jgi:hypothetical protein
MSEGFAVAPDFSTFAHEPPLSPEPIGDLRLASPAPIAPARAKAPAPVPIAAPVPLTPPAPALTAPAPAPDPVPTLPAAAPPPVSESEPPPAPEASPGALRYELSLRLVGGERLPLDAFAGRAEAEQRGRRVTRELNMGESWPLFGDRYVNPAAVVSVDIDLTGC